jgi:aspartate/methionine/tyrosine aminotransferase
MRWAKTRARPRVDLAGSNLAACSLEELPRARESLDLSGESPDGFPPLLDAIAARYGMAPVNVATAVGCSGANFLAMAALLEPGDEVLVERPNYDPLVAAARMLGARPRFFDRRPAEGFRIDPAEISRGLTDATRLIVVSNPHNPSGVYGGDGTLRELARLAEDAGVPVLVDEVYLDTLSGGAAASAAMRSPLFVASNSLTKSYGLSSLRCGWTLASPEITERIRRARDVVDVSGPIPAERLAVEAFRVLGALAERARRIVEANRLLFRESLRTWDAVECVPFDATIAFPRFRDGRDASAFAARLFDEDDVAVVPGAFFGLPDHFRVSLGGPPEAVRDGLECLGRRLRKR